MTDYGLHFHWCNDIRPQTISILSCDLLSPAWLQTFVRIYCICLWKDCWVLDWKQSTVFFTVSKISSVAWSLCKRSNICVTIAVSNVQADPEYAQAPPCPLDTPPMRSLSLHPISPSHQLPPTFSPPRKAHVLSITQLDWHKCSHWPSTSWAGADVLYSQGHLWIVLSFKYVVIWGILYCLQTRTKVT